MSELIAVGIDLGTTYSAVAYLDDVDRTEMIRNAEHETLTPTAVFFDTNRVIVGNEARKRGVFQPDCYAECVKRDMGSPVYSRAIRGRFLPPEFIQAHVLRQLKTNIARAVHGGRYRVVITVPAFFDESRRKATADAGELSGLDLVDIVNEPTAAALAFGEQLGYLTGSGSMHEPQNVLVYDLGGGTFDATIVEFGRSEIKTLATDGDVRLGGRDWDQRLADYVAEKFVEQHREDPRDNAISLQRLLFEIEEAKRTLSVRSKATVVISHAGSTANVVIGRETFEDITEDLLTRTSFTVNSVLREANLTWRDISRILLCGGATRMPQVPKMIEKMSGRAPERLANPDEAVARGAAIYCDYRLNQGATKLRVRDVNAHSLGILGVDQKTGRKRNAILIPRNSPLPVTKTREFVTKSAGQATVIVNILEGEGSSPDACTTVGRTIVSGLPATLPAGWPVQITYTYTQNGRLTAHAEVPGTGRETKVEFERDHGLTGEQIVRWRAVVEESPDSEQFEHFLEDALKLVDAPAAPGRNPLYLEETDLAQETKSLESNSTDDKAFIEAKMHRRIRRTNSAWAPLLKVGGHLLFSLLGLLIGYILLRYLKPEMDFLRW